MCWIKKLGNVEFVCKIANVVLEKSVFEIGQVTLRKIT